MYYTSKFKTQILDPNHVIFFFFIVMHPPKILKFFHFIAYRSKSQKMDVLKLTSYN